MPRAAYSRHEFADQYRRGNFNLLVERVPYRYREFSDNISHTVKEGDTLNQLAYKYYNGITPEPQSAASLWWIIADFQPNPIIDGTLRLQAGQVLIIPSKRTVIEEIFSTARSSESKYV